MRQALLIAGPFAARCPATSATFNGKFSAEVIKTEPSAPADLLCN